jgi:hypothetical protein
MKKTTWYSTIKTILYSASNFNDLILKLFLNSIIGLVLSAIGYTLFPFDINFLGIIYLLFSYRLVIKSFAAQSK